MRWLLHAGFAYLSLTALGCSRRPGRSTPEGSFYVQSSQRTARHAKIAQTYARRDNKFYQRRHQLGYTKKETDVMEKEVHYVMGSGNHSRNYLQRTAN